jgi:hypothetical protein
VDREREREKIGEWVKADCRALGPPEEASSAKRPLHKNGITFDAAFTHGYKNTF